MNFLMQPYDRSNLVSFLKNDFLPDFENDVRPVSTSNGSLLNNAQKLGESLRIGITVFEVVCDETDRGKRVAITQDAFRMLRETATRNALVVFFSPGNTEWRLSLLTSTFDLDGKGKVISRASNPRRYSYLLGPRAKTVTPSHYLIKKGLANNFEDLQKRFSVEVVNKEFYSSIAELFTKLVGGKRKKGQIFVEHPGLLRINGQVSQSLEHQEFAVRLIGRLVFCWFLREKKSIQGTSLIPDTFLSAQAAKKKMYYHSVLEPLFFELLNQKQNTRKEVFRTEEYSIIPYLNGGLFSPQKGDAGDHYEYDDATSSGRLGVVDVPDEWLVEFTQLLDTYNFTVDENTSYDIDLSVDPEMLGRIFENLLAEINPETGESARKSTGSFYTPREVVEYMVDRSLIYYLESKTGVGIKKLEALVSYSQDDDLEYPRTPDEEGAIVEALSTLTILDPACGSGAYPIGILQKVVYILQQVDKGSRLWLEKQLAGLPSPELRRHLQSQYENQNYDYIRKLGVIRDSIFGVDIQSIATEIARLRCFLTLIVEESVEDNTDNRGIHPLPNLDFKFVTANSLISLPEDKKNKNVNNKQSALLEDISHINQLRKIRDKYFGANSDERTLLRIEFGNLQRQMLLTNIDLYKGSASKLYDALTRWEPFAHKPVDWFDSEWMFGTDKFDIVIANPPYLGEKGHKDLFRKIKEDGLEKYYQGKMDLFYFFFHLALNLNKQNGITAFITTNYYPTATGAKKLRKDFFERTTIKELINFNELKIFESALGQHNMITIMQRTQDSAGRARLAVSSQKGVVAPGDLMKMLAGNDNETTYSEIETVKIYDGKEFYLRLSRDEEGSSGVNAILDKLAQQGTLLGDICNVNVGLYTGADKVSANYIKKYDLAVEKGEGIFVLSKDEYAKLGLDLEETRVCVPFFKNSDINRYVTKETPDKYLIDFSYPKFIDYPTDKYPNIIRHLLKYKVILENRESNDNGLRAVVKKGYWWLYTKRKLDFGQEKIVAPQRSPRNTFGYNEVSWHASADVYFITKKSNDIPLKYVLGLLNSSLYYVWLYNRGKRKGEMLELYQTPLSEIPIKISSPEQMSEIIKFVEQIVSTKAINKEADTTNLEGQVDQLVYKLFGLSLDEISLIEASAR